MNQTVLVGRLVDMSTVSDDILDIKLSVTRSYKDKNGEPIEDVIPCRLVGGIATNTNEYCTNGDIVGIRGSIEEEDGEIFVKADKVTFLASKSKEEVEK